MRHESPGEADELTLIQRATRGDHEAFCCLVLSYEAKLLAYLTHMLGDPESARDVAQDTFLAVYHSLPDWRPSNPPRQPALTSTPLSHPLAPWLYRIATNRALSLLRKQTVRARAHDLHAGPRPGRMSTRSEPFVQEECSFEERFVARDLLREALRRLPEADAACLVLHFVAGEPYGEIAARLALTSEGVRKRISRALGVLREVYATLDMEVH